MKRISLALLTLLFLPVLGFAEQGEEDAESTELAQNDQSFRRDDRSDRDTHPKTNPRWYRNPEAREAYLRGEEYRHYPRKSGSQSNYYKRDSNQGIAPAGGR